MSANPSKTVEVFDTKSATELFFATTGKITPDLRSQILPDANLSVPTFSSFPIPSLCAPETTYPPVNFYFTDDNPNCTALVESDFISSLRTRVIPGTTIIAQLLEHAPAAWQNGSRSVVYAHIDDTITKTYPFQSINDPDTPVLKEFPGDMSDDPLPTRRSFAKTTGRPKTTLLDQLSKPCHERDSLKQRFRCVGDHCEQSWAAPQNRQRILRHASSCHRIPVDLRRAANELLSSDSVGARVEKLELEETQKHLENPTNKRQKLNHGSQIQPPPSSMEVGFAAHGRKQLQKKLDFAITKLICAASLPPTIANYAEWKEVFAIANSAYNPPCGSTIAETHIPGEAARVRKLSITYLKTQFDLTISYDGGTTKFPQSVYTVHFTTPDGRSFLIEGEESTETSHTGEHICGMLLNAMDLVGRERFSGISSDSTGNTRLARELVCAAMIKNLRSVITFFRKSSYASGKLTGMRKRMKIPRGLDGIGKTRFATICSSAISLEQCLPAVRELISSGIVKMPPKKAHIHNLFEKDSLKGLMFEIQLKRFISIESPFMKCITCHESSQSNPADVFKSWIAINGTLKQVLNDPKSDFSAEESGQIRAIANQRFNAQIQEAPTDCYISAFYLDPRYVHSNILHRHPNPLALTISIPARSSLTATGDASSTDLHVPNHVVYLRVLKYLKAVFAAEFKSQHNPILQDLSPHDARERFTRQFERYARGQYPFNTELLKDQTVLAWWTHLTKIPEGSVLACIAKKIYSVKPCSMPDERTVSVFTRMNSPLRNRQEVRTLVDMTQIRQWHMYDPTKYETLERPTLDFCDIKSVIFGSTKASDSLSREHDLRGSSLVIGEGDECEEVDDDEKTSWMEETVFVPEEASQFDVEVDINLDAPTLLRILADEPLEGAPNVEPP
ncbi:ribonuclease H-like domain-containing protein [Hygrophoropsis aurantiaca]|uniref:Ribonuclease H-like domain-containing protein n=1 Tax=Hygrophoropsis aurantiaca TaxID=72124 RepID=A0ACB7ZWT6_9AGAM|nr:ribonuclease H-like domain-containing protein [Hygrophoropsis aurantiaca]